jgi:hypothetical protein
MTFLDLGRAPLRVGIVAALLGLLTAGCEILVEDHAPGDQEPPDPSECPSVPPGSEVSFPIEENAEFRFDYFERDLREQQPEAPITRRTYEGDLVWKVENVSCTGEDVDFVIRERFEGSLLFEGWAPCEGCEVEVFEDGPHQWERTLHSRVRSNQLHIPGYVQGLPDTEVSTADRRHKLTWILPTDSPDTIEASGTLWAGFGSSATSTIRVRRDEGILSYQYSSSYRAMMYSQSGRTVELTRQ